MSIFVDYGLDSTTGLFLVAITFFCGENDRIVPACWLRVVCGLTVSIVEREGCRVTYVVDGAKRRTGDGD